MATRTEPRIVAILSGGQGRRMGGIDKGSVKIGQKRLVDFVVQRLSPQVDEIVFAGDHDYGHNCRHFPDHTDGPAGPAAGLFAICAGLSKDSPSLSGFFTVPIDAPFIADKLIDQLAQREAPAIAVTGSGVHPTFAYWRIGGLMAALENAVAPSLRELAIKTDAKRVLFPDENAFMNVNTPEDLAVAGGMLRRHE